MNRKTKIIIISVLLALAFGTLIFAAVARGVWDNNPNTDTAAADSAGSITLLTNAANAENGMLTANGVSTDYVTLESSVNDTDIGISPMGWWEDLWKIPEEIDVYGTVHAGDKNTTVSSGSYTNKAYGYTAPDGFPQFQYSTDGSSWNATVLGNHMMFSNTNTNGWKYYRGYKPDPKGDYTKVSSICLDTVKPQIQVRLNGSSVASGTVTTSSSATISILGSDSLSGVNTYWYTMNGYGGTYYQCYSSSTFSSDGVYTFYCVDRAGNVSDTVTITKDTTAPTVRAYNGSSQISNGAIVYASTVRFEASDSTTGVNYIYVRTPGTSYYSAYASTSVSFTAEGLYYYYASDKAGNYSSTYTVTVDRTAPTAYLYSGTTSVSNNYFSAASYIRFTASDTNGCTIYMKKDSGSYGVYTSGTNQTAEGVYSFYAVDPAGNSTSTYTITLDRTAPVGTLYAGTTVVSSGKITNASYIKYTATDNLALNYLYVRTPGASSYVSFTSGTQYTADGTYYFYATDKSGNASSTVSIVLDRTKPVATITAGTTTIASGGFTNSNSVKFSASDATSGVSAMYVRLPNTSSYISYVANTPFSAEGIYYFYATDVAGNIGDTVNITIDITKPTGTLTANGSTVTSGSFTNKAFYYTSTDSLSGISKCEIKRPGSSTWETYTSGTTIAATSTQGLYSFRSTDKAGNVSIESQINLVTNAPTVTIYAGTTIVSSGTFVNSSYVAFTAAGASGATVTLYVKIPGGSFALYAAGTQLSKEGNYEVYATDNSGNTSATVTVTLDITKPTGTLTANGSTVTSGSFTNKAFYYSATDSLSGVLKCEIKRPNGVWEAYNSGTTIAATSANGLYSFRSTDKAGNVSIESQINLVTNAPTVTIYAGTTTVSSGTYTNKSYVAFTVTAYSGATASLYVKIPGGSFALYAAGTQLSKEGKYEVYATDNAGNTSSTLNLTLDISNPVGTITANGTAVSSGDYVNSAFKYAATDNVSGIAKLEILRPSGTWQTYSGDEITVGSGNGWYSFRATDNAGNVSAESKVYLLTSAPIVQLYVNEQPVSNGTYTNSARISMSASGGAGLTCYVKTPGASGYTVYNQYFTYTAAGRYEFYAEDAAGNKSGTFAVIIDRTAKPVTISGISNGIATGDVSATWNSGTTSIASIVSVKINGIAYTKGSAIKTIDGGIYNIESTDAAGNVWTTTFTAQRTEILSKTLNKQYYETKNGAGNTYAFESYDNALAFAAERENALVRTAVWNGAVWDGGIAIDSIDSANAKNGTYYIYKKSGDKSTEVAYFTLERLNTVIAEYAAESVNSFYWWQKTPAQSYSGNDLYSLKDSKVYIGDSVTLASHANYLIDGMPFAGLTYDGEGIHTLTVYDNYGNSYEYVLKISKQAPKLNYMVEGGGVFNTATADRQYNFAKAVTVKITDDVDDYAMFYITNSAGETVAILSLDDEYVLNKSGRYTIQAVGHSGKSEEFVFILSLSAPAAAFTDNGISKRLEMRIESSQDLTATLTDIKIYKSTDSGLTWVLLTADDYGRNITVSRLFYEFNTDGIYKVVIEDNFRNGLDAVTSIKEFVKPAPVGTLNGVTDGGITNGSVKFVWTDEAFAYLTYNGETASYLSGTEITAQGDYVLEFCDGNGYSRIYTFSIDKTKPIGTVTANGNTVQSESYINKAFKYSATDNYGVAQLEIKRQSGVWEAYDGSQIAATSGDGWYIFRAVDLAGNVSEEIRVYLITTAPTVTLYAGTSAVENGAYTNNSHVSFTATSAAGAVMYVKAPGESDYTVYSGAQLTAEGAYYFYAVDLAGNVSGTMNITLDKGKPVGVIATDNTGGYTNKAFSYSATDGISGVARLEIKRPNGVWETYNGGQIAANSGDGWYAFRAFDLAGNVSEESRIYLITAAPQTAIYAGLETLQSGMFTNKGNISFTATSEAGVIMYVKLPGESNYSVYIGTQLNVEGTYYFYAADIAGNVSNAVSVTLDTSLPTGIVTASGAIIEDGGYINKAFIYSATDDISGIARLEIKCPGGVWETYNGEAILASSGDGWYAFRAFDLTGNMSNEIRVYLITAAPSTVIHAGTEQAQSGSYTNKSYITFDASSVSGVTMYVKTPSGGGYALYDGAKLSAEGIYYFYAVDAAGNISDTVSITLDKSNPVGVITSDGATIQSGSYTNKAFSYSANDEISGIARLEIKRPGGVWESYNGEAITPDSKFGLYAFRAIDLAGNISAESQITLLTDKPIVQLYADENPVNSGTYTNAARISMSAQSSTAVTCYVKQPSGSFILYNQYFTFSAAGRYEFYAVDQAGNQSEVCVIIIDRTAKSVSLSGVSGGRASGDIILSWTSGDGKATAAIVSVTVNGLPCEDGTVIKTINGGAYVVKSIDAAGNVWTATFTAQRTEILSETLNKQYFETKDGSGKTYAFDSYENAIAFATARENALVRTAVWNGSVWDGGIPMDTADSANAQNGTYFIYKKSGDKSVEVAYFTLERLNAVIAEYAEQSVSPYYWWDKNPAESYDGNDLYRLTADRIFIGNSVTLAGHASYLIDGNPLVGLTYTTEGEHVLTVLDSFGNSYDYTLIIVRNAPDILYSLDGDVWNTATADRQYAFNGTVTVSISDALDGGYAIYIIRNNLGEIIAIVNFGEEYTLAKSGRYTVAAINHGGQTAEVHFTLSLNSPTIELTENELSKRLEIRVQPSSDNAVTLTDIRIYISTDSGITWTNLGKDDYGRTISASNFYYEFNKDGLYKVVIEDNFRSGIEAVTDTKDYVKPAPKGTLIGVTDGGYTNGSVKFTWTDEATARLTSSGKITDYVSGSEITEEGIYLLEFKDTNGYSIIYTFTIDKTAPAIDLSGKPINGYLTEAVSVTFENGSPAILYLNGELIGEIESGTEITEDGQYKIVVTDFAGNMATLTFTLDSTLPTAELVGVSSGGTTKGSVMLRNPSESVTVEVYLNGNLISYSLGDSLSELGSYRVTLTDAAGNMTEYTFEITYSVNAAGTIIIFIVIFGLLGGGIAVFILRKRGKFKTVKGK